jgi:hypothetical protein
MHPMGALNAANLRRDHYIVYHEAPSAMQIGQHRPEFKATMKKTHVGGFRCSLWDIFKWHAFIS